MKEVRAVFRTDLPPSIFDLAQEMGRAGRTPFANENDYKYQIYYKLEDVLYLFGRIHGDNGNGHALDDSYKEEQVKELVDVISLLSNQRVCHKVLVEQKLGDPQQSRVTWELSNTAMTNALNCSSVSRLFIIISSNVNNSCSFRRRVEGLQLIPKCCPM